MNTKTNTTVAAKIRQNEMTQEQTEKLFQEGLVSNWPNFPDAGKGGVGRGSKLIYLASPYSHPDPAVRELRYKAAVKCSADLLLRGHLVYSPIVQHHPMQQMHNLPNTWEFWKHICLGMLKNCDELWVLKLPGWQESVGIKAELSFAEHSRPYRPIRFLTADECAGNTLPQPHRFAD